MDQGEFEKSRAAQVKAINTMIDDRTIKVIDLIELLLKRDPSELVVLPDFLMRKPSAALEDKFFEGT